MSISNPDRVTPVERTVGDSDGSVDAEPPNQRRRLVIGGVLGGIAVIILFVTAPQLISSNGDAGPGTIPAAVSQPPMTNATQPGLEPSRLDILVDGYQGTLILAGQSGDEPKLWRWESNRGTPLEVELPENSFPWDASNADGSAVPILSPPMEDGEGMLSLLDQEGAWPVTRLADFEWHSFDPIRLVWIDMDQDGRRTAMLALVSGDIELAVPVGSGARVARYDSEGLLIQQFVESELVVTAIDLEGREVGRIPGRFVGSLPDGSLLIEQDTSLVKTSRRLTTSAPFDFPYDVSAAGATASPTGPEWAIWESLDGQDPAPPRRLWVMSDDELVFEVTLPELPDQVIWSNDGRWLITSAQSGELWFIDTFDRSAHQVQGPGQVYAVKSVN